MRDLTRVERWIRWVAAGGRLAVLVRGAARIMPLVGVLAVSPVALTAVHAGDSIEANPPSPQVSDGFRAFCAEWMRRLADRERINLRSAQFRVVDSQVVAEYTGYAREPLQCVSRVKEPGSPGVGIIVYQELHYRCSGANRAAARASEPQVLERIEITEIFRYDGSRWVY